MLNDNTNILVNGAGFKKLSEVSEPVEGSFICTEDNIERLIYYVANHCLSCVNGAPKNGLVTKQVAALIDKKIRSDLGIENVVWNTPYIP